MSITNIDATPKETAVAARKPRFITFTGADDATRIGGMVALSEAYPIEWGVLFSPKRQGSGRYPSLHFIHELAQVHMSCQVVRLSAHLCGGDARDVIERGFSQWDWLIGAAFNRVQINTADPTVSPSQIGQWASSQDVRAILQCRGPFPDVQAVDVLFDASGGRGVVPGEWPRPAGGRFNGYAGGLSPSNVAEAVQKIGGMFDQGSTGADYWIDMETGVRNESDKFDLGKCQAVCQAVFGY